MKASRIRNALCAAETTASLVRGGRAPAEMKVRSPLLIRMVEAWAPMHSHMFLSLPEYHEHSWHFRLRKNYSEEMDDVEVEMAAIRFDRYAKLMAGQGFTHLVLDDQDYLPLFPAHPEVYPPGSSFHTRHTAYRKLFRRLLDSARKYDLGFILFCQEIGYTTPTLDFFGEL